MEHEVFVPVSVPSLRRTLSDSARVARCVPGLQQDADASADPLSGRMRIRVGGHTITYRGALRLSVEPQDGPEGAEHEGAESVRRVDVLVAGEGVEARGGGSVKLSLTIGLTERDSGTAIGFAGTVSGDGRILDLEPSAALTAAVRLLDRFAQQLVTETLAGGEAMGGEALDGPGAGSGPGPRGGAAGGPESGPGHEAGGGFDDAALDEAERSVGEAVEQAIEEAAEEADTTGAATARRAAPGGPDDATGSAGDGARKDAGGADDAAGGADESAEGVDDGAEGAGGVDDGTPPVHEAAADEAPSAEKPPGTGSVFDAPVPPPSLDPGAETEFTVPDGPPAKAAHARRTMTGRSAEEVDHAPPRGRYAPVPSPDSTTAGAALRWIAPAAALALASAVVVGRVLRRRKWSRQ